ncbi:spermatogenesis-associated protein 6 isoform X2 [Trichoplusia ni]|uniref:Spermatogenesis-associated protein 6 isoform X2 n=1 Tax=Trichoplusia ni TaxID=7111 RepID=A0A7E5WGM5_TRINI|nr:spermatogenesis-associated protein 6 isoform X2 [Trichoplusia ni]
MPKIIELTVEIDVQRVSCPGVWLCQDGRVSLTVFALGTSYQTCLLPPVFPLMFKDVFYFRKRFQETCALNNICCLLKDETIYCELVQWSDDCASGECTILAQYLGALNDVLFPPNMCSSDGVDLLMRRSKDFPGILSPKIEIATKVRIDEVWNQGSSDPPVVKMNACHCSPRDDSKRQKQVCHSAKYHRTKCTKQGLSPTRSRSRSVSTGSRSCCSLSPKDLNNGCGCPNPPKPVAHNCLKRPARRPRRCRQLCVYNVQAQADAWPTQPQTELNTDSELADDVRRSMSGTDKSFLNTIENDTQDGYHKTLLESQFIDRNRCTNVTTKDKTKKFPKPKISPCVCQICKRYHELFHMKGRTG